MDGRKVLRPSHVTWSNVGEVALSGGAAGLAHMGPAELQAAVVVVTWREQ